ncbi:MAG: chromosome segregation protein SMC [Candidatus Marsarchaeota archaeon]|nr:chromosome segregation protein SMC [Candidatus Marsarchaeota archaeon]
MLYLKSMSIDKFKSFKHISVIFNKGFNCVVGPNGSGKSNIVDALLFSLGENSLRRLRVDRLQYLIREGSSRGSSSLSKAHVKIELDGDEKFEITRGIRADGKTVYRLNGKRMTRQDVIEVLKKHMVHIDETSTIAQGEINKIIEANAKQRREFIDIAAGIQEFEYKKKEAMSELEKVGVRVSTAQAMLNERLSFLNELAKEKDAAESYLTMSKRLKALNYSILIRKQKASQLSLDGYAKEIAKLEGEKKAVEAKLAEYSGKISALSEERQKISDMLTNNTSALDGVNKKLGYVSNELSALEVKMTNGTSTIEETEGQISALTAETKAAADQIRADAEEAAGIRSKLGELEAQAKKLGVSGGPGESGKRVKELDVSISALEKDFAQAQEKFSRLQTEKTLTDSKKVDAAGSVSKLAKQIEEEMAAAKEMEKKAQAEKSKKERAEKASVELQSRAEELRETLSGLDSQIITLKEQRAASHSRDGAMQGKLKAAFADSPGFFGTVADLCTYDGKNAEAVESAAGSRFNYFVVDSIETANEMIQYLRKQNLGRATFMPLRELRVETESKEKGLQHLTSLLKYDSKFAKVFEYIFSNTYLVNDVDEAKSIGIGRHRYVTASGELVERAGIVSGGSRAKVLSIASIEKKLKELESARTGAFSEARDIDSRHFNSRKEVAEADIAFAAANSSIQEYNTRIKELGRQKSEIESSLSASDKETVKAVSELESLGRKAAQLAKELEQKKQERSVAYNESLEAAQKGMSKEAADRLSSVNKEIEAAKIRLAEIQQQDKMLNGTSQQKGRELAERNSLLEKSRKAQAEYVKRKTELQKEQVQIESRMKKSSKSNKEALERQDSIAKELEKLITEQAGQNARSEGVEKQANDVRVRQGQVEMRLNDIAAELTAYGNAQPELLNEDVEKMEKESGVLATKIEALGNVNLKAPEAYDEKAQSVNEATVKVNTLEGEKKAVLAMIEEIDSKKLNAFITTFNEVSKNFSKLYNYIYPGKARIELDDVNNPLNTGLSIKIEDPNFVGHTRGLSGGQKSLISLMLLFSIHMCKPSSIYLFDEIDTALDKENSQKLSQLIKQMAKEAQFIVVSHNDSLIVNADVAVGVTKSGGDSQVYGIEISNVSKQ